MCPFERLTRGEEGVFNTDLESLFSRLRIQLPCIIYIYIHIIQSILIPYKCKGFRVEQGKNLTMILSISKNHLKLNNKIVLIKWNIFLNTTAVMQCYRTLFLFHNYYFNFCSTDIIILKWPINIIIILQHYAHNIFISTLFSITHSWITFLSYY